jgi:ribosomal 50S subunit-recycling heat shock protein
MRLDLYLKYLGIEPRRAHARELIDKNRVRVNDHLVKPSYQVKPQDRIQIYTKAKTTTIRVLNPIHNYETL